MVELLSGSLWKLLPSHDLVVVNTYPSTNTNINFERKELTENFSFLKIYNKYGILICVSTVIMWNILIDIYSLFRMPFSFDTLAHSPSKCRSMHVAFVDG